MAQVGLNLSIPDPGKFESALDQARKHGLTVTQAFEDLGIASGSIEIDNLAALMRIDGIVSVEPNRPVSIPKPVGKRAG